MDAVGAGKDAAGLGVVVAAPAAVAAAAVAAEAAAAAIGRRMVNLCSLISPRA
jgi:hypothetical protein